MHQLDRAAAGLRRAIRLAAILLLVLLTAPPARAAETTAYLRVESGAHGSAINRAVLGANGTILATVSDDKTARLWAADTLAPLGVIRPPLGPGDDGALYAATAAGNLLVVGGRIRDGDRAFRVQFYRLPDMKLVGQLARLPAPVSALQVSRDRRVLAVGMVGTAGLAFYDLRNGQLLAADTAYAGQVQWIDMDAAGRTVASGEDGRVRLYGPDQRKLADAAIGQRPLSVAFAPDGQTIAIGSQAGPRIDLVDGALRPLRALAGAPGRLGGFGVAGFSADGTEVLGAGSYRAAGSNTRLVRRWASDGRAIGEVEAGLDTVTSLLPLGSGLVFADGTPRIAHLDPDGRVLAEHRARGVDFRDAARRGFAVSDDGATVALPLETGAIALFDTRARSLTAAAPGAPRPAPPAIDPVAPKLNGRPFPMEQGERAQSAATSLASRAAVIGTNFHLRYMRPDGAAWHTVVPAPAWAVAISGNGRWVVAGLGDGTVRWYAAEDGREALDLFVEPRSRHWVLSTPRGFFDHDTAAPGQPDGRDLVGFALNDPAAQVARFIDIGQLYARFYRPDLVGLALRTEPIARATIADAERRQVPVANVLEQGLPPSIELVGICGTQPAQTACPSDATLDTPNPTDRPGTRLATKADALLVRYRLVDAQGTPGRATIARNDAVIAPTVQIVAQDATSRTEQVVIPLGKGANRLRLTPASTTGDVQGTAAASLDLAIWRASEPGPPAGTTLYLVSVGVSAYQQTALRLENAANDARAVTKLMETPDPPLYQSVVPIELLDDQATRDNVGRALAQVAARALPDDLVVIFIAGHGQQVDGHYYFAPTDLGTRNPTLWARAMREGGAALDEVFRTEGIGPREMMPLIQSIKASHLAIVLDTCFSGSLATQDIVSQRDTNATVTNALGNAVGRFVLSSSTTLALDATPNQAPGARDPNGAPPTDQLGHGLFTSFLLAALQGEADLLRTGRVDVVQLANYTIRKVVQATAQAELKQQPTFYFSGSDFFALRTYPVN